MNNIKRIPLFLFLITVAWLPLFIGAFDKTKPAATTTLRNSNPEILANNAALEAALDQDHDFTTGGTQTGKHEAITLKEQSGDLTTLANEMGLYCKDLGSAPGLYLIPQSAGTAIQLTGEDAKILSAATDMLDEDTLVSDSATKVASQQSIKAYVDTYVTPPGVVVPYAGSTAPTGYLLCNGAAVSRTTYAALFAVCGTTHGSGNGSTTFNVPNLVGYFVRGLDTGKAVDPDTRTLGSTQAHGVVAHVHRVETEDYGNSDGGAYVGRGDASLEESSSSVIKSSGPYNSGNSSYIGLTETRPVNKALNYIIKT